MSKHSTLKATGTVGGKRSVLKRFERVKLMKERGIESVTDEEWEALLDEVWEKFPPAYDIDFRMTLDRKNKYRVSN